MFTQSLFNPRKRTATIHPKDLWKRITSNPNSLVILDVRSPAAYANGHIPGAVSRSMYETGCSLLVSSLAATTVVVYGQAEIGEEEASAARGGQIGQEFFVLRGGWLAWIKAGLPIQPRAGTLLAPGQFVDNIDANIISGNNND